MSILFCISICPEMHRQYIADMKKCHEKVVLRRKNAGIKPYTSGLRVLSSNVTSVCSAVLIGM